MLNCNGDRRPGNPAFQLSFPPHPGRADRKGIAEAERFLNGNRSLGAATAQRTVDAVDVRRARMTADLAELLPVHRSYSDQGSCLNQSLS
jgi:hypothetical protein